MYAIVEFGGMQWKVSLKETIRVPKIALEEGKSIDLERVLLVVDKDDVIIGKPLVADAMVKATVISHGRFDKILVFKKKRKKNYKVMKGHRQGYTELRIDSIAVGQKKAKLEEKPVKEVKAASKPKAKEAAPAEPAKVKKEPVKAAKKEAVKSAKAKPETKVKADKAKPAAKKAPVKKVPASVKKKEK